MSKGACMFDFRDFEKGFEHLIRNAIPQHAANGLRQGAALCLRDAVKIPPTVPKKTGFLRSQQRIEDPVITRDEISVRFGFNTSYASRLHEAPSNWNWSQKNSGPKFLETKMAQFRKKYMEAVAAYILSKQPGLAGGAGAAPMPFETEGGGD